jgi:hypothetical protein
LRWITGSLAVWAIPHDGRKRLQAAAIEEESTTAIDRRFLDGVIALSL